METQTQLDTQLVIDFFLQPSDQKVEEDFKWVQADHPQVICDRRLFPSKIEEDYLTPVLEEYFRKRNDQFKNEPLSELVQRMCVHEAEDYARRIGELSGKPSQSGCVYMDDAHAAAGHSRIYALLKRPEVIADPVSLQMMRVLRDLSGSEPWSFNMWESYEQGKGYQPLPGFGVEQIAGYNRLVHSDDLWAGRNEELGRIFFGAVASALRTLSKTYFVETIEPRVELLRQNHVHAKTCYGRKSRLHEPWCGASFYEAEIEQMERMVETAGEPAKSKIQAALDIIGNSPAEGPDYFHHPHCC